ncbi:Cbp6 protein [Saccharomycopsis crataegensis]|uniref:Cbp6 protein n=1 Tax=Saccharomycopsis crataegensis TaxID=43959 RepID=A0AAV5QGJ7_9ASCO|nr:Cbp6 protein [Saccharomycopsis crataegensis]
MSNLKSLGTSLLNKINHLPKERLNYSISFKESQYERFRTLAGAPKKYVIKQKKPSVKEIIFRRLKPQDISIRPEEFSEKLSPENLKQMIHSLDNLSSNKFAQYYKVGDKLMKPSGYPDYYQRLMGEIQGTNRESWFSAFRTVVFGK